MASSATSQTSGPYPGGAFVLYVGWENDPRAEKNAAPLLLALDKALRVEDIEIITCNESKPDPEARFVDWLNDVSGAGVDEAEASRKRLLIICYLGHGLEARSTGRLRGGYQSTATGQWVTFDLTNLQELARDNCFSDSLWILECCDADCDGMEAVGRCAGRYLVDVKMETLGAGVGSVFAYNDARDFTRRLAAELNGMRRGTVVTTQMVFEDMAAKLWPYMRGFHRQDGLDVGQGPIMLPVRR